jgi:tripartite ATP-independent transporter DctP family solute receptor
MKHHGETARHANLDRRGVLKLGAAAASFGLAGPAFAQRAKVFRYGHNLPADTTFHEAAMVFAKEVGALSGDKMKVDVYPASQLGSIPEMLSALKSGSLAIGMANPGWYSNFMKPVEAFALPFLAESADRLKAGLDGKIGAEIGKLGEAAGFKVLGFLLIGGRHIVNRVRTVRKPADCQGLKLRVINSQVYIQAFRALGAATVVLDPSELYVAMQQGVIDGFEYDLPSFVSQKFYEVGKYLTLDAHVTDFFIVSVNKGVWDGLNPEEQGILQKAMKAAMDFQWKVQPQAIEAALGKLRTLIEITDLTPAERKVFVDASRPVYQQFEGSIGKDFLDMVTKELA